MSISKKSLQDAAQKVGDLVEILRKSIDGGFSSSEAIPPEDARLAALRAMCTNPKGAWSSLLGLLGGAAPAPAPEIPAAAVSAAAGEDKMELSFEEFLTSLGEAMLDAQKQLDSKSAAYLGGLRDQPHVLPSVFRMPKLSGTMKFALGKSTTNQMNLVFYSSGSQESSQHQQEIQFEMVAAPAPLAAMDALRQKAPRIELVLDPSERGGILRAAQAASGALVLRVEAGRSYLLLDADEAGKVGCMAMGEGGSELPAADVVRQAAAKQDEFLKLLRG